jgi:hypothetical protein
VADDIRWKSESEEMGSLAQILDGLKTIANFGAMAISEVSISA